jgi:NAD(P)-dependent dehydrogenase (short-subunit alcohol dehydrogenase family)
MASPGGPPTGGAAMTPGRNSPSIDPPASAAPSPAPPSSRSWSEEISAGRFFGKTVIVTGGGSGIGRATASRIAREGGRVIAADVSASRLDDLRQSLSGLDVTTVVADITDESAARRLVSYGGSAVSGLANIAGIMDTMRPVHEVSDAEWSRVMAVNVDGMMRVSRAVVPQMLERASGSIVNIGSEASFKGSVAGAAYVTSKHAVVGLTKSMAFMYGPQGIRVNAVAPGAVLTNIVAEFDSPMGTARVTPMFSTMPAPATAEQLASLITFLLSDDAVNINGAIIPSDGGWSVQ